jgi:cbb3-type cytochrome oxidase maturation protein
MTVLFVLVPLALIIAGSAVIAFLWAVKNGQLDDLETPALRILQDDEVKREPDRTNRKPG